MQKVSVVMVCCLAMALTGSADSEAGKKIEGLNEQKARGTNPGELTEPKIQQKLNNIKIPGMDLEDVTIPTAIKFLCVQSKQLDPEGVGVNIVLRLEGDKGATGTAAKSAVNCQVVNLSFSNKTLGEAIHLLCQAAKLKCSIEENTVVIGNF